VTITTSIPSHRIQLQAGDVEGHEFHGNQWTEGVSAPENEQKRVDDAYAAGQKAGEKYNNLNEYFGAASAGEENLPDYYNDETNLESNAFESGLKGLDKPKYVTAIRIGKIPERGQSTNFAEQKMEPGVSVLHLEGEAEKHKGTFEMFNPGKKIRVAGWLYHKTGSDGEPLLVRARELKSNRVSSQHPLEAAAGPLPGQIERVIVSLQNDGRLPIRIPPETMRHVTESLARYFQTASADKIEQFAEAAKAAVEAELKTENIQTVETMKADTTGVNVGATPATSRGVLTDFIESATGDNIGGLMNMDFFNRIMREVTQGAGNFVAQNFDQTRLDEFPALELHRVYDREVPRGFKVGKGGAILPDPDNDWPSRWEAAGGELVDGRMVALKSDPIWQALGDGDGGYEDTLGNPFAPFAFNSGFDTDEVSREDAVALGLMDDEDEAKPADFDFTQLLNIEAASAAGRGALEAGDVEGHEFHGNQWTENGKMLSDAETPDRWEGEKHAKLKDGTIVKVHGYSPAGAYGDKPVFHVSKVGGTYATGMIHDAKEVVPRGTISARRAVSQHPLQAAAGDVPLVVKCFITDANGRLLVLQADGYGRMDLPGGHLRAGETVDAGLRREVLEETGMTLNSVKELGTVLVPWNGQQPIVFFSAKADTDAPLVLSGEHVDWFWLNKHEVALRNFSALNKVVNNFTDGKDLNSL
jgi:8-oxo-dGTP pyrophosphatase MutT (NUDIX family)